MTDSDLFEQIETQNPETVKELAEPVKYKIIGTDNYGRDHISDHLVCENVNEYYGKAITKFLNERFGGNDAESFYKLVPINHKLYIFEA